MGDLASTNPKSLVRLANGETILERQIRILSECGINDFIITTGPFEDQIKNVCSKGCFSTSNFVFVKNPIYDKTNYIYSMYLAEKYFDQDLFLLHGDLVFDTHLIKTLLKEDRKSLCLINKKIKLSEKDFKGRIIDGLLKEVSINIFDSDCFSFQPLYKLSKNVAISWSKQVAKFIEKGWNTVYAENALNEITKNLQIEAFSYEKYYIDEIDNPSDLLRVSNDIRLLDFKEQPIFSGNNSYKQIERLINENHVRKPLIVCDKFFENIFLSKYINSLKIKAVFYNDFSSNPLYEDAVRGLDLFNKENCDFIISIGGGSTIDTAKCIKLFSASDLSSGFLKANFKYSSIKHLAIPTTSGTGSESTRFSVIYFDGEKQSIAHDSLIPDYVILEPTLIMTVPLYQKKATMLDALCQAIESYWSLNSTRLSKTYSRRTIQLIIPNIDQYLENDIAAVEKMQKAANLSGKAINITQTTAAHAMSYKITSLYGIPHGIAVAMCLPKTWDYMRKNIDKNKDARGLRYLRSTLKSLDKIISCEKFIKIFHHLDIQNKKAIQLKDIDELVHSVNELRLNNNPVRIDSKSMYKLYKSLL